MNKESIKKSQKTSPKRFGLVIIIATIALLVTIGFVLFRVITSDHTPEPASDVAQFSLSPEYYDSNRTDLDLSPDELQTLISDQKSFVVYVSLPLCTDDTARFREFVDAYQSDHKISFYYMTSDKVKNTPIYDTVKYYPSVILYKDGKLVKYLDFNSDTDVPYYKTAEGFAKWIETYLWIK